MKAKIRKLIHMNDDMFDTIICTAIGVCGFAEIYAVIWFLSIISG